MDDRDLVRVAFAPREADPPLVVDANAVLPDPISAELLQAVAGWDARVVEGFGSVDCIGDRLTVFADGLAHPDKTVGLIRIERRRKLLGEDEATAPADPRRARPVRAIVAAPERRPRYA